MTKTTELKKGMRQVEKNLLKIMKKIGRNDLGYTVQIAINSNEPTHFDYVAAMTPPAERVKNLTWHGKTIDELIEKTAESAKKLDHVAVDITFQESNILRAEQEIEVRKEYIKKLKEAIDEES